MKIHKQLLYSKMKAFHFKEKIDSLPEDIVKILPPIHIRIKPTNICNHRCRYCAYRADNLQLGKDMVDRDFIPKKKMMEIVNDIVNMRVRAVSFSGGGEPFCYPFLLDAVLKLSKNKVKFAALTNGSRLQGETAQVFAHCGTWIRISIDGWDDKSYSYYRNVPLTEFSKVISNMESFKKMEGKCFLGVSIIVDKHNAGHLYGFIKMFKDIGVDSVKISPCIVSNSGRKNNAYHKEIFAVVKGQIARSIKNLSTESFEICDAYHQLDDKFLKNYTWCPYQQILPVIGADLNIYPCQDKAYNLDEGLIGSIKHKSFKRFWSSDKKVFFKINPSKVCNHHCVANQKNKLIFEYLDSDNDHLSFV